MAGYGMETSAPPRRASLTRQLFGGEAHTRGRRVYPAYEDDGAGTRGYGSSYSQPQAPSFPFQGGYTAQAPAANDSTMGVGDLLPVSPSARPSGNLSGAHLEPADISYALDAFYAPPFPPLSNNVAVPETVGYRMEERGSESSVISSDEGAAPHQVPAAVNLMGLGGLPAGEPADPSASDLPDLFGVSPMSTAPSHDTLHLFGESSASDLAYFLPSSAVGGPSSSVDDGSMAPEMAFLDSLSVDAPAQTLPTAPRPFFCSNGNIFSTSSDSTSTEETPGQHVDDVKRIICYGLSSSLSQWLGGKLTLLLSQPPSSTTMPPLVLMSSRSS